MIKFLSRIFTPTPAKKQRRDFAGARLDRLTSSWKASMQSADSTLRFSLPVLRGRSRDLAENNDYVAGYLELLSNKVIGPRGIRLQMKSRGGDGKLDRDANAAVEKSWSDWGKRGICDVTGRLSWAAAQKLALISMARDGEIFVRRISAPSVNSFHFALQFIEADMVDINKNDTLENGNTIRMAVELNPFDRPIAYHVFERHPGDFNLGHTSGRTIRIPADEMLHIYKQLRPGQTRGIPWTSSVMTRLHHLGAYEEAAIINARTGASKMGFFLRDPDKTLPENGDTFLPGKSEITAEPGQFDVLPVGYDFKAFDPAYPSGEYDGFVKRQIKGASCGLPGASYAELSNDLESVSFSSIRQGTINSRESYRDIQQLLIEQLCLPVYESWLTMALSFGLIVVASGKRGPNSRLSVANFDKYANPVFVGRGWEWVDPLKDEQANTEGLANKLTTRTRILAELGEDFEEMLAEQAQENQLAEDYGIDLNPPPAQPTQKPAPTEKP